MIERIKLRNFKAFCNLDSLPLSPLTVLCGANSSGKSSILQSLLLWKQTMETQQTAGVALLNGRLVRLGSLSHLVYGHQAETPIELSITIRTEAAHASHTLHTYQVTLSAGDPAEAGPLGTAINVTHAKLHSSQATQAPESELRSPITADQSIEIEAISGDEYKVRWKGLTGTGAQTQAAETGQETLNLEFIGLFPSLKAPSGKASAPTLQLQSIFAQLREALLFALKNTSYLGPLREEPARRYIYEDEALDIGVKGENAAYLYLTERYRTINAPAYFLESDDTFTKEGGELTLSGALSKWLTVMGINDFSPEQSDEIIRLTMRSGASPSTRVNLADVGFGVSQVFPILLEGLRLPINGTLLLEQPEIHLHPKLELQLADFLLCLALGGKQVIVETHSDHIINRLVRRMVESDSADISKNVSIYFLTPAPEGTRVECVRIDDSQGIINWPVGFFDQAPNEQEEIIRAGLRKRMQKRGKQT